MSLWDPEAAGNAAVFLRLDDMKMLEIRNAPFDGGKAVWVPNSETGYIKGTAQGDGDKPNTTKVSIFFITSGRQCSPAEVSKYASI